MVNEIVEKNYRVRKTVEAIRKKAASCSVALGPHTTDATPKASNLTAEANDSDSFSYPGATAIGRRQGLKHAS